MDFVHILQSVVCPVTGDATGPSVHHHFERIECVHVRKRLDPRVGDREPTFVSDEFAD